MAEKKINFENRIKNVEAELQALVQEESILIQSKQTELTSIRNKRKKLNHILKGLALEHKLALHKQKNDDAARKRDEAVSRELENAKEENAALRRAILSVAGPKVLDICIALVRNELDNK